LEERRETECDELHERWAVADLMMDHTPQTIADLALQAEAYLIADMEILSKAYSDTMMKTIFHNIRTLGALPQPEDPLGVLSINSNSNNVV
jgi:hypothetical protein